MHLLKNKHIILAMFVAPVLAIIAYFATDYIVSEKPQLVQQGKSYKLAARPNCRYPSGLCTLHNGDIEVDVRVERVSDTDVRLVLTSTVPVANGLASFGNTASETQPATLYQTTADSQIWNAVFNLANVENSTLRLALEISGSIFYAETPAVFIDYETTYSRDNFSR